MTLSENESLDSNLIWDKGFASLHLSLDSFNDHSIFITLSQNQFSLAHWT